MELLGRANKRTHNEFVLNANLHGMKLKPIQESSDVVEIDPAKEAHFDKAMRDAQERKRQEMLIRKAANG